MKIGGVVDELPLGGQKHPDITAALAALEKVPAGKWLVLECVDAREASARCGALKNHPGIRAHQRGGKNIYVSRNGTAP